VTGNGGHDSSWAFDGLWAANAPQLQEDFGWHSNHVVALVTKVITTQYYGKPIKFSYMAGGSKGGQAALLEAQRFPDDFDGVMPIAPVYDFVGRVVIAAAPRDSILRYCKTLDPSLAMTGIPPTHERAQYRTLRVLSKCFDIQIKWWQGIQIRAVRRCCAGQHSMGGRLHCCFRKFERRARSTGC
jgi:hypothetical protein